MRVDHSAMCVKCQDHMSWARPEGVLLVGGTQLSDSEPETAELVNWDGTASQEKFNLSVIHRSVWFSGCNLLTRSDTSITQIPS